MSDSIWMYLFGAVMVVAGGQRIWLFHHSAIALFLVSAVFDFIAAGSVFLYGQRGWWTILIYAVGAPFGWLAFLEYRSRKIAGKPSS